MIFCLLIGIITATWQNGLLLLKYLNTTHFTFHSLKKVIRRETVKYTDAKKPVDDYIKIYPSRQIPHSTPTDLYSFIPLCIKMSRVGNLVISEACLQALSPRCVMDSHRWGQEWKFSPMQQSITWTTGTKQEGNNSVLCKFITLGVKFSQFYVSPVARFMTRAMECVQPTSEAQQAG